MTLLRLFAAIALVSFTPSAEAHRGSISFTTQEREIHAAGLDTILQTAAGCLEHDIDHHLSFFRKYGISPYYGDRSEFGKLSWAQKKTYLAQMGKNPALLSKMEPTSCVGLSLKCLGAGFKAAGQDEYWQRLRAYVNLNDVDGTALQAGLQQLGWEILYWNPDSRKSAKWDRAEQAKNPTNSDRFWGYHEHNYRSATGRGRYLYNKVDDARLLLDFGSRNPKVLRNIPFFVGTAHQGYHVFPGTFGKVVEAHSTRKINDIKTLESDDFNPLAGKAPTGGMYKSGLIAVPPGYTR